MTYGKTIGIKFYEDGSVRRYPGNTVVADITPDCPAYTVMTHIHDMVIESELDSHLILLPRNSYHMTVIQGVTEEVKKGRNYLIFPEGTRSRKGNEMLDFHGGSFRCATKSKCPILPIALVDSYKVLDEKGSKPISMQLHYLDPIYYEEYQNMKPAELAALVKERIGAKIQECTQGG